MELNHAKRKEAIVIGGTLAGISVVAAVVQQSAVPIFVGATVIAAQQLWYGEYFPDRRDTNSNDEGGD